jgi:hypothetical protein
MALSFVLSHKSKYKATSSLTFAKFTEKKLRKFSKFSHSDLGKACMTLQLIMKLPLECLVRTHRAITCIIGQ